MPEEAQRSTKGPSWVTDLLPLAALAAVTLVVVSIVWIASEQHYRSCIAKAQARYPAVPVSAFTGKDVGPVKVSFVKERASAVNGCHHF